MALCTTATSFARANALPYTSKPWHSCVNEICVKPFTPADLMKRMLTTFESPRPFIRNPGGYVGPDRRRHNDPKYKGPDRRRGPAMI